MNKSIKHIADNINRRPKLMLTIIALLLAIQISPWWYPTIDVSLYLSVARNMAVNGSMVGLGNSHSVTLPGYPAMISPAFLFGDRPFLLLSVLGWLMAVTCMLGVYVWARQQFSAAAMVITGLVMLNTAVWFHYRRTLKEIAFMMVVIWTVNALNALSQKSSARRTALLVLTASLLLVLATMIRYAAIVLAIGFGLTLSWQIYRREMPILKALVMALAVAVPASASIVGFLHHQKQMAQTSAVTTPQAGFSKALTELDNRFAEGLRLRVSSIGRITIPGMFKVYALPGNWLNPVNWLYVLWMIPVMIGWWRLVRHKRDVLVISFPLYFALYIIWPSDQGAIFLVPMAPLLMGCIYYGISRSPDRRLSIATVFMVLHCGVALGYWIAIDAPRARVSDQKWSSIDRLTATIQKHPGPVAMSDDPALAHILLQLTLDKERREYNADQPIADDIRWLILLKNAPMDDRFTLHQTVGEYRLYSRRLQDQVKESVQ